MISAAALTLPIARLVAHQQPCGDARLQTENVHFTGDRFHFFSGPGAHDRIGERLSRKPPKLDAAAMGGRNQRNIGRTDVSVPVFMRFATLSQV
jgi:hypothetical protein